MAIDALQVASSFSGVGSQALALGHELRAAGAGGAVELRCAADARPLFEAAFPAGTTFWTPVRRSRPRWRRIVAQQLLAPLRDLRGRRLVCLGDQGPVWGRAEVTLVLNDVRRLTRPETAGRAERTFYRFVVARGARRARTVATISEFSRAEIRRVLGREAELVRPSQPPLAAAPERDADGHLLVVGALRDYKGVDTAIAALGLLAAGERRPLVIAGPDEGAGARLRRLALETGVAGAVRFTGWVPPAELAELRRGAAAVLCPSVYEGYGLPLAEALARGLPAIATDIPAHRELAGDAALYFEPGDARALAACLRRLGDEGAALAAAALAQARDRRPAGRSWRQLALGAR